MSVLYHVSIALLAGLLMTRLFKKLGFNFPDVTAFLISGLLIGPVLLGSTGVPGLGLHSFDSIELLTPVTQAALGFIAFSIGSEFKLDSIKQIGKQAFVIGVFQALLASLVVDAAMISLHFILGPETMPLPAAITLGAIASATAPAATLMVVRQYKAEGPVTRLLLPIVALDDAVGLIIFAVSIGVAQAVQGGALDIISVVINPLIEILSSLILGTVLALILTWLERLFLSRHNRLNMTIVFVLMAIGLASQSFEIGPVKIAFSNLLVLMMLGTVFCNLCDYSDSVFEQAERWTSPLYATFFVLSGAELDIRVFKSPAIILIGVIYILFRCLGKYFGARFSSKATNCDDNVVKYLGITLFPQAGVALGMVSSAAVLGEPSADLIRNIILFSVLIYELVGPSLTRIALTKAGEITPIPDQKKSRDRFKDGLPTQP